jgi:hypothetical protein
MSIDPSIKSSSPISFGAAGPGELHLQPRERGINDRENEAHNSIFIHLALPPVVLEFRL